MSFDLCVVVASASGVLLLAIAAALAFALIQEHGREESAASVGSTTAHGGQSVVKVGAGVARAGLVHTAPQGLSTVPAGDPPSGCPECCYSHYLTQVGDPCERCGEPTIPHREAVALAHARGYI